MIPKENNGDKAGAHDAGSVYKENRTNGHCNICGSELRLIFFRPSHYGHICFNWPCFRYRSPQFYTEIPDSEVVKAKPHVSVRQPSYSSHLDSKKANYHLLRSLNVPSVDAARMTSNKQTQRYLESIGYKVERGKNN